MYLFNFSKFSFANGDSKFKVTISYYWVGQNLAKCDWLLKTDFNMFFQLYSKKMYLLSISQKYLTYSKINFMLSKGDFHFNPVCLHATAVSLHSRPHRQTGPEPHEQQQQQQLQHKSSCLYWTFQGHLRIHRT